MALRLGGVLLCLLAAGDGAAVKSDMKITAVQKVIQMLTDMSAKAKEDKHAEEVSFSKFSQFCSDTKTNKAAEIDKENQLIESLAAEIAKLESDVEELANKIDELQQQVAKDEADMKKAKAQREKDHASYTGEVQDFAESVDALERAIAVLQKQTMDKKQAEAALLQLSQSPNLAASAQQTVAAFLELNSGGDFLTQEAPEANAYEFQSGSILNLLKQLRDEFASKKAETEKEELNSRHASEMLLQDLTDSVENANADIADKTQDKNSKQQRAADLKKELGYTTTDRDEDVAYLKDLTAECFEKSESFKEKQQLRAEEIAALEKACEILSSAAVSGAAAEHLPTGLLQRGRALAQLRAGVAGDEDGAARRAAVEFLAGEGRRLHSKDLGLLAQKMAADPFVKVKKLISQLITRLLEEANQESEQKGFCDKELGTNEKTRAKLSTGVDELTASVDEHTAAIGQATERLAVLSAEVAELQRAMAESTTLRTAESEKNAATVADAQGAQKAIQAATAILKDFYAKAGAATALLQVDRRPTMGSDEWNALANPDFVTGGGTKTVDKGHKAGMQTFGKVYQGQRDEAGGVLAMLEVIGSDFATLEVDTQAAESKAAKLFQQFMDASTQSVSVKEKESSMLTADRAQAESDLVVAKKDLAATQDELLAADRYYAKLKPTCVDSGVSFEDRAKARQEEIASLQEALRILGGEDIA